MLALGLYREAERTLSVAEALNRYGLEQANDPAVALLTRVELAALGTANRKRGVPCQRAAD